MENEVVSPSRKSMAQSASRHNPRSCVQWRATAASGVSDCLELDGDVSGAGLEDDIVGPSRKRRKTQVPLKEIRCPGFAFPRSMYLNTQSGDPPIEFESEAETVQRILEGATDTEDREDYYEAELHDFCVYRRNRIQRTRSETVTRQYEAPLANELVSLQEINERNANTFLFDGFLCFGNGERHSIQGVEFDALSIGFNDVSEPKITDMWIQSLHGKKRGVWYHLGIPALEYRTYHTAFLWIANLTKHLVDFLDVYPNASLQDFRLRFYEWLVRAHDGDAELLGWAAAGPGHDFRSAVAANANFIWCQATSLDIKYEELPLWTELVPGFLSAVREQRETETSTAMSVVTDMGPRRKTTVTPYVYGCYSQLPWAKFLYSQAPKVSDTQYGSNGRPATLKLEPQDHKTREGPLDRSSEVNIGDVVAIPIDQDGPWKSTDNQYYAYVQGKGESKKGRTLDLIWLYKPTDTICRKMAYPHAKELFLSDHCNCDNHAKVYETEVLGIPRVAFFGDPTSDCDYFCRQQYLESEQAWVTLSHNHFKCDCQVQKPVAEAQYSAGDTLLVRLKPRSRTLEPVIVLKATEDHSGADLEVRLLLRRGRDYRDEKAAPNELVYTDQLRAVSFRLINRKCHIRIFPHGTKIPFPYDRQGTGDFFFITAKDVKGKMSHEKELQSMSFLDQSMLKEGWMPIRNSIEPHQLVGLDIFCGGGTFGRGLEEAGMVDFKWAVDCKTEAIHSYKANLPDNSTTKLFFGSVNDYLSQALGGTNSELIAQRGEVDVIIAGSPCQGFSTANRSKGIHHRGLLNESMVASVVSYIDFYRPKYALLENVKGMASGGDDKNMLAQIVCSIVGMGYQTRTFALDAWNYGSPQGRSRIFISCTAAGLDPLLEPPHTHSHPTGVMAGSLGKTASGMPINPRFVSATPFACTTVEKATRDLPRTDGRVACLSFPDHRMSRNMSTIDRVRTSCVPRYPAGQTFTEACRLGYMPAVQTDHFVWTNNIRAGKFSRCWSRVKPNAVMPTVMTEPRPSDGVNGRCLHWEQHRLLTIQEVRRGQGFPDEEVLIGSPPEQWRIVGNSVARPVAFALGLSLRNAWLASVKKSAACPAVPVDMEAETETQTIPEVAIPIQKPAEDDTARMLPAARTSLPMPKTSPLILLKQKHVTPKRNSWAVEHSQVIVSPS